MEVPSRALAHDYHVRDPDQMPLATNAGSDYRTPNPAFDRLKAMLSKSEDGVNQDGVNIDLAPTSARQSARAQLCSVTFVDETRINGSSPVDCRILYTCIDHPVEFDWVSVS